MQNVIRLAKRNFIFSEILETAPKNLKRSNRKKISAKELSKSFAVILKNCGGRKPQLAKRERKPRRRSFLLNVNLAGVLFLL